MTTVVVTRPQRNRLRRDLPILQPPGVITLPYLAPELQVGDVVDYVLGGITPVYPFPTILNLIKKNGATIASGVSPSYTIQAGDVGAVLVVTQHPSNTWGADTKNSSSITAIAKRTPLNQAMIGGNVGSPASYSANIFLTNGCCRTGGYNDFGGGSGSGYHSARDANGYPTTGSTWFITAPTFLTTLDGCLPASVDGSNNALLPGNGVTGPLKAYRCTYVSGVTNTSADVTATGGTIANWQNLGGGNYYFELTVPQNTNVSVSFAQAIQYWDIPAVDGVTPSATYGEFLPANLANAAQFTSIRLMDVNNANQSTDTTWASRMVDYGPLTPFTLNNAFTWERTFRYCNALYTLSGGATSQFWICIPGKTDDNYVTQLVTLANSMLMSGIHLVIEWWNEVWNNTNLFPQTYCYDNAYKESWVLQNYATDTAFPSSIASITATGGVATVTLNKNLNQYFKEDGTTPFLTNGALCYAVNQTLTNYSGSNSGTSPGTAPAAQVQVAITTGGALAANQFSYPCATAASGAMGASQMAFLFNVNSTLVSDVSTFNLSNWWAKFHVRRVKQIGALWKAVRPTDELVLGLQQYGNLATGGGNLNFNGASTQLQYGNWLGNGSLSDNQGLKTWCDIVAIAPYVYPLTQLASTTSGSNVVNNVPFAAHAVAGDTVQVSASGQAVYTTVVSGVGTDLTVADNITFTANKNAAVTYGRTPQVNGYVTAGVLTVTSMRGVNAGSHICKGAAVYGDPGVPGGTVVSSYGTGTGDTGTYNLSNNFSLFSSGSPGILFLGQADTAATLWAMLLGGVAEAQTYARCHAYTCKAYGVKCYSYEGGPDTSKNYAHQVELWTYGQNNVPPSPAITMGSVLSGLLDAWYGVGCSTYHHFIIGPAGKFDIDNDFGANYAINQSYGDPTPAYLGLVAYRNKQLAINAGPTPVPGPADAIYNVYNPTGNIQTTGNAVGMCFWASNAAARRVDFTMPVPRTRRYQVTARGSDSTASTGDIYLDDVLIGSVTWPVNGVGSNVNTTPGTQTSPPILVPVITHGAHNFSVRMNAGVGSNAGVKGVNVTPY